MSDDQAEHFLGVAFPTTPPPIFTSRLPASFDMIEIKQVRDISPAWLPMAPAWGNGHIEDPYVQYEIGKCEYRNRQFFPKHLIEKCCWFSLLIDAFRAPFNKQPGNTYPKNLDYKKLWEICSAANPIKFGSEYRIEVLLPRDQPV